MLPLIIPFVHNNGTLVDQAQRVALAAAALVDALRGNMPNGRDYYPITDARDAWGERAAFVSEIKEARIMRNLLIGFIFGWLVSTIGFAGVMRIAEKITGVAQAQVMELSK